MKTHVLVKRIIKWVTINFIRLTFLCFLCYLNVTSIKKTYPKHYFCIALKRFEKKHYVRININNSEIKFVSGRENLQTETWGGSVTDS